MYKRYFKRLFSFIISLVALFFIGWFLAIIALWLHYANKGAGAFFMQERPGLNGRKFKVLKFKTMTDERDKDGNLLPDGQRITKVGRFVRSTSIDELPQFINILKGDMALIGPRPLLMDQYEVMDDFQRRRFEVRPGISGWAQVHGRNHCKLSKKFEYDVWYVDHCSLFLDLKIIWLSVVAVFKRSDIGVGNEEMEFVDDIGMMDKILELRRKKGIKI